ncbi:MAG: FAD:protein FMN transferase [Armatimonadota bacterium]
MFKTPREQIRLSVVAMACRFELVLEGDDPVRLRAAGEEALAEIESLDNQLSRFNPLSEVSRVNRHACGGPVKVDMQFFELLSLARSLCLATGGAFDITICPLVRLWRSMEGESRLPGAEEIEDARQFVGIHHLLLDPAVRTVRFDLPGVEIDLGAIGKGYAIERAVECLRAGGVERAVIHGGTSTVYGIGEWNVGISGYRISRPDGAGEIFGEPVVLRSVTLCDSALSVSATYGRSFELDGQLFGHVLDPRTGMPVEGNVVAAVWGPSPTYCDALSTALLVNGEDWLEQMRSSFVEYEGMLAKSG